MQGLWFLVYFTWGDVYEKAIYLHIFNYYFFFNGLFFTVHQQKISNSLGIKMPENIKIEYENTHEGFYEDGITLAKIQFKGKNAEKILSEIKDNGDWRSLPLTENIKLKLYGGEKGSVEYISDLAERLDMPEILNGYWIFIDRFKGKDKINDDRLLFERYSSNYTVGIYDVENNILHYCKFDS